jgi:hypothetical protein
MSLALAEHSAVIPEATLRVVYSTGKVQFDHHLVIAAGVQTSRTDSCCCYSVLNTHQGRYQTNPHRSFT